VRLFTRLDLILLTVVTGGCAPEIAWRGVVFDPVFADAQRDNRLTFVYLRNWYMPECTRFEESVLNTPEVIQATADCYAAKLEFDWSQEYARRWGVSAPPAVVILDPQGRVLARVDGTVDKTRLLDALRRAHETLRGEAALPAAGPPTQPGAPGLPPPQPRAAGPHLPAWGGRGASPGPP